MKDPGVQAIMGDFRTDDVSARQMSTVVETLRKSIDERVAALEAELKTLNDSVKKDGNENFKVSCTLRVQRRSACAAPVRPPNTTTGDMVLPMDNEDSA